MISEAAVHLERNLMKREVDVLASPPVPDLKFGSLQCYTQYIRAALSDGLKILSFHASLLEFKRASLGELVSEEHLLLC